MAATSRIQLDPGVWTLVATGSPNVLVQRILVGAVEIVVAASEPSGSEIGHTLAGDQRHISFNDLSTATDKVYARADAANTVAVTK